MSDQDALTRLEKWLLGNRLRMALFFTHEPGIQIVELKVAGRPKAIRSQGPDLATAINAALDRAEEQGL